MAAGLTVSVLAPVLLACILALLLHELASWLNSRRPITPVLGAT
jgi:predicted PurR-regulated permease PerM